tara:strand:+ start:42 stop:779 length:738 start_codon:yes stop_codon:yes gene_type:complete
MFIEGILINYWVLIGLLAFFLLLFIPAPYGKFTNQDSKFLIPSRIGWILMEIPASLITIVFVVINFQALNLIQLFLFLLWNLHYLHRSLIWPFRAKISHKKMHISIALLAFFFNVVNASLQSYWIIFFGNYEETNIIFYSGLLIFFTGMYINIKSDNILMNLRTKKEEYVVPTGFLFKKITSPNYFGETIEWLGWALLTFNFAGFVFFIWTIFNLLPRAISTHKWYHSKFKDYPKNRKIFIPYIF